MHDKINFVGKAQGVADMPGILQQLTEGSATKLNHQRDLRDLHKDLLKIFDHVLCDIQKFTNSMCFNLKIKI